MRITKTEIERLPTPLTGDKVYWDDKMKGFGVRITAKGARSFITQKRLKGLRRSERQTHGQYPNISPEVARELATVWFGKIANRIDPRAERDKAKLNAMTLKEAFDDYVILKRRSKDGKPLKPRTVKDMLDCLGTAFADWQSKPLPAITREMVERRYGKLCEASVARASIAMRYLRAVYNFTSERKVDSEGKPLLADNPVRVLKSQWRAVKARKRVMIAEQLAKWIPAVRALAEVPERAPGEGKVKPRLRNGAVFRDLFLFIALTGARDYSEALNLRPGDVDLVDDNLTFVDTKNRLDHALPLTPTLKALLKPYVEARGAFIFVSPHDGRRISNFRVALDRVRKQSGVYFTPHDLRRLAATAMERGAVPAYTIKAVINHLSGGQDVTGDYVQVGRDMKLAALLKIEEYVMAGLPPSIM